MARYNDNAPIGNTCPTIDNIIGKMEYAKGEAEYILKHQEEDSKHEANSILGELIDAISDMESIRSDNQELRQWGNDEYNRAEDANSYRGEAVKRCEDLETEVDSLKAQIEELQEKPSEVTVCECDFVRISDNVIECTKCGDVIEFR